MSGLRKLWESIVYAGMKPSTPGSQSRPEPPKGGLRSKLDEFLTGGPAPSDPFYLTNRSLWQRARVAIFVTVPCVLLVGLVLFGIRGHLRPVEKPVHQPTPAEIAQATLPNLVKNLQLNTNHDLEVAEARIQSGSPSVVVGSLKNNSDHRISNVRVVFTIIDDHDAKLGYTAVYVDHVDAKSSAAFSLRTEYENAAVALVKEIVLQ